jgi:leader peptidase (prepilin peptidase) / N-methyltransferase
VSWISAIAEVWSSSPYLEAAALLLGLVIGSFANVCIHRIPLEQSVVHPPSRCPSCGALIGPLDNVPVLSFVLLRGRCRSCRARISPRYPLVEATNGLLWMSLVAWRGLSAQTLVALVLLTTLLVLSLIDLDHFLLPDVITLPGIGLGFAASFLPGSPLTPFQSAAAALGAYLTCLVIAKAFLWIRGIEGLGEGDWKMAALLGAFLGWQEALLTFFLASLVLSLIAIGLILFRGRAVRAKLPLGTFLGMAGILVVFIGAPVIAWYGSLLRD